MKIFLIYSLLVVTNAEAQLTEKCQPLEKLIGKINDKKRYIYSSVNKIMLLSQSTKCDDGAYAESMSDIVVQSLVRDFVRTIKVAGKSDKALSFVVAHVNSTTEPGDLLAVTENAKKICPEGKSVACKKIDEAAKNAIKESR